jgi:hypothetical protein
MTLKPARTLLFALLVVGVALPPATASAAKKKTKTPTVSSVAPLSPVIGDTLTIRGRNFRAGRGRNTVVFKRDGGRAIFVTAGQSTTTMMRVTIPVKLSQYLSRSSGGTARPTRFRLRILSARFGRAFTATRLSPRVGEAKAGATTPLPSSGTNNATTTGLGLDCNADKVTDPGWSDYDADLMAADTELAIGTDPCSADSDSDGVEDGWEYRSAYDLNRAACTQAFPAACLAIKPKKAATGYPNPLNADAAKDFDGDSLSSFEEFTAWKRKDGHNLAQLWYSGGLKSSIDSDPSDGCIGMTAPAFTLPALFASYSVPAGYSLQIDGIACLRDDERDEDGDLLNNYVESHGPMSSDDWWNAIYEETAYSDETNPKFEGTDWLTTDSDNDGYVDGLDDQDNDTFLNLEELVRGAKSESNAIATGNTTGLWVQPFNPCLPSPEPSNDSACTAHPLIGAGWPPLDLSEIDEEWPLWGDNAPYTGSPSHLIARPH